MDVPTLAVWKFASCDGCQLTLLDCEDELLAIAGRVKIARFVEASSEIQPGPYDVSLVEGSITTADDAEQIRQVREMSRTLVTIGACATAGGVQALRNFADVQEFTSVVYARPDYISTLATSTQFAAHVDVDFELHGCRSTATAAGGHRGPARRPQPKIPAHGVCFKCSRAATCASSSRTARRASNRDARGVRCAVPGPPSRLLRLFRRDEDPQRGGPSDCCGPPA